MNVNQLSEILSEIDTSIPRSSLGFALPKSLLLRWQSAGPDFHENVPLLSEDHVDALLVWWLQDWGAFTETDSVTAAFLLDLGPYFKVEGALVDDVDRLPYDWLTQLFNSARDFSEAPFKVFLQSNLFLLREQEGEFHSWIVTIERIIKSRPAFGRMLFERVADLLIAVVPDGPSNGVIPPLQLFSLICEGRSDLRALFDMRTLDGFHGFVDWFLDRGIAEYWLALHVLLYWLQPVSISDQATFLGEGTLPEVAAQSAIGLNSELDFISYADDTTIQENIMGWWLGAARSLHARDVSFQARVSIVRRLREFWFHVNFGCISKSKTSDIPRHLSRLYEISPELRAIYNLNDPEHRVRFLTWWTERGSREHSSFRLLHDEFLFAPALAVQQDVDVPVTNYWIHSAFSGHGSLGVTEFSTSPGRLDAVNALMNAWSADPPVELVQRLADRTGTIQDLQDSLCKAARTIVSNELLPWPTGAALSWWRSEQRQRVYRTGFDCSDVAIRGASSAISYPHISSRGGTDVEIVGFPRAESGQGEDARTVFASLSQATKLDISLFHTRRSLPTPNLAGKKFEKFISPDLRDARVRIFALSAFDMLAEEQFEGLKAFSADYLIGYWPWELSRWPKSVSLPHEIVDEIWSSTQFSMNSQTSITSKPFYFMPLPVTVDMSVLPGREAVPELSKNQFNFVFVFDGFSYYERKNPLGVIRAFQLAFPKGKRHDVGLVIKAMNADQHPILLALKIFADDDSRIKLIYQTWDRPRLLQFIASADALVSLHRSEGFGRIMAEAMLLETPVIASDYSGNRDFCNRDTAFLVGGHLKPLLKGHYIHWNGQEWFEPSIEEAAVHMRSIFERPGVAASKIKAARQKIVADFSLEACGRRYSERIAAILA